MQLGFVIDHSRCIGCHACTVACKSENAVPVGSFRTWVKYTEEGEFPSVRRSFGVLRCNQCTDAPCVAICPVSALEKRPDGIVDVDPDACIGCKSCMQGCPYDALYINDATGTAEKCHFCAHRTEVGLAPACAVICPTEAIIPGDFHDPHSVVSRLKAQHGLQGRKVEAGTGPNVLYREVTEAAIKPLDANAAGGLIWANQLPGLRLEAQEFEALEHKARARTVYDVEHPPLWGRMVAAYLFTKSLAAGVVLAGGLALLRSSPGLDVARADLAWLPSLALLFLLVTTVLLVADLKRPERFLLILRRPNWGSWLARGSLILMGYGALLTAWLVLIVAGVPVRGGPAMALLAAAAVLAALTAAYTAWLFAQAKGRVLWMNRAYTLHLLAQAGVAGCGLLLLGHGILGPTGEAVVVLRWGLIGSLALHGLLTLGESWFAPRGREEEYRRAAALISHGPFARLHWRIGIGIGVALPILLLLSPDLPGLWAAASLASLVGLYVEEETFVRAGQALPIS